MSWQYDMLYTVYILYIYDVYVAIVDGGKKYISTRKLSWIFSTFETYINLVYALLHVLMAEKQLTVLGKHFICRH